MREYEGGSARVRAKEKRRSDAPSRFLPSLLKPARRRGGQPKVNIASLSERERTSLVVTVLVEAVRVEACEGEHRVSTCSRAGALELESRNWKRTTPVTSIRSHPVRVVAHARRRELLVERRRLVVACRRLRRLRRRLRGSVVVGDGSRRRRGRRRVGGLGDLLRRDLAGLRNRSSGDEETGDEGRRESEESEAGRHGVAEVKRVGEEGGGEGAPEGLRLAKSRRLRAQQRRICPVGAACV